MIDLLLVPFQPAYMQRAALAAVLIALACAPLGVHLVQRRLAWMADALAHALLPGLVLAQALGSGLGLGALAGSALAALLVAWAAQDRRAAPDGAIGSISTTLFALGVILLQLQGNQRDLQHLLLGHLLGITTADLWLMAVLAAGVLATLALLHKELLATALDPEHARLIGLPPTLLRGVVLGLCAVCVALAIRAVGVVLTAAMLVTPAATALLCCRRFVTAMFLACGLSLLAVAGGLLLSWHAQLPPGASIVVLLGSSYIATQAIRRLSGRA